MQSNWAANDGITVSKTYIASKFWEKLNFPNCIGATDGKHITIVSPAHSGSMYFNYKGTFSIGLLALADAEYRFTFLQVGDFWRTSDGGVYSGSSLGRAMEAKKLSVPADCPLPGSGVQGPMPYTMVRDAALTKHGTSETKTYHRHQQTRKLLPMSFPSLSNLCTRNSEKIIFPPPRWDECHSCHLVFE